MVDPGVVDVSTSWMSRLTNGMRESLDRGDREKFNRDMGLAVKIPALARTLAFRLVPGRADVFHFGADEGAAYHCQPTGRLLTENRMFDWLTDLVPAPHR